MIVKNGEESQAVTGSCAIFGFVRSQSVMVCHDDPLPSWGAFYFFSTRRFALRFLLHILPHACACARMHFGIALHTHKYLTPQVVVMLNAQWTEIDARQTLIQ